MLVGRKHFEFTRKAVVVHAEVRGSQQLAERIPMMMSEERIGFTTRA